MCVFNLIIYLVDEKEMDFIVVITSSFRMYELQ